MVCMKKGDYMRFLLSMIAAALALSVSAQELPTAKPEREGMSAERLQRVALMNDRYTDTGKIAGTLTAVVRNGKIVHASASGQKSATDDRPIEMDDLFRIYSMSKPITAVAAMQLYEQGKFQLTDPVSKFIPELKDLKVMKNGKLVPAQNQMTMQQLLNHTAGLSYGFDPNDPVDQAYQKADLWGAKDLDEFITKVAELPLKFEPGEQWHYSIAVDVTGLVVERLSGQSFDAYLKEHIFDPLDMTDTFFEVPEGKTDRFLPNHFLDPKNGKAVVMDGTQGLPGSENCGAMCDYENVTLYSGGGGLVSTLRDYVRFAEAMRDGELDGVRILSPKTVNYMSSNHLPSAIASGGGSGEQPNLVGNALGGFGFGLGFGIVTDTAANGAMGSAGQYYWGGAAGTVFWIDPVEDIVVVSMMQLMGGWPSYRPDLRVATYQSIVETNE
ncbi:MAG: CubicO group peptidase (beta-lactamase class C family) [Limisphaerales bacterium]|jgi:CubicO group peptidase (beta-lactamase class C family)